MARQKLKHQAVQLPSADRERLASSVDSQPLSEVDEAWILESERRLDQLRRGEVQGIPGEQVFDDIRRSLGWQR